jgi:predicted TIM-barrel fold metal-dependent hydrolase
MIIDAHTHIFPPEVVENRERFLDDEPAFAALYTDPKARLLTAEGLIAAMDEHGVDVSWVMGFPWLQEDRARLHNEYLAGVQKEYEGRLKGLACVHLPAPWAFKEAERALAAGMPGLGELAFYKSDLHNPSLDPFCKLAAEADVPLLLHTNEPVGHHYHGKSPMTLAALYALILAHPQTKLVLAHMGGGIFFYALMKRQVKQALANVWLDTAAAPFLYEPRAYKLAVELLGADKLLLGSDYPLLPVSRYLDEFAQAGLLGPDLDLVLGKAAQKLIP